MANPTNKKISSLLSKYRRSIRKESYEEVTEKCLTKKFEISGFSFSKNYTKPRIG